MVSVGKNLKRLRVAHGLTQQALASMSGVSRSRIAVLETRDTSVGSETLQKLASAIDEPVEKFFASDVE